MDNNHCCGFVRLRQRIRQRISQEVGSTLVYVAMVFPVLLALAGVALDGSNLYIQQQRMQIAANRRRPSRSARGGGGPDKYPGGE